MRLSDQDSAKDVAQDASQGVILVSTKGPIEGASKVSEAEGFSKDASKDSSKDASQDLRIGRKAKSKITNARTGHFKNFFMC